MTAHEILKILDLNNQIIGDLLFKNNKYQGTYPRYVLLYAGNLKLSNIDLSHEKDQGLQNRNIWYLW